MAKTFSLRQFILTVLIVGLWVNASEVFRYFLIVMPQTRDFLSALPGVAPMDWGVFFIWGLWDTLLTASIVFTYWLVSQRWGHTRRSVVIAGAASWCAFFLLFWVGMVNMSLAPVALALVALPLALLETLVGAAIARALYRRWS